MQALLHVNKLFTFAAHHLGHRDAGCAGYHLGDFLSADLRAQQARLFRRCFSGNLRRFQARLERRQLAILQFSKLVELPLALELGHLRAHALDLFLDRRRALDGSLLTLPDDLEVVVLALQLLELFLDDLQAAHGRLVGLLLDRFALDLELNNATIQLIHDFRLGVDLHADAGRCLVDQVDRLIRQKPVGDVTVGQLGRGDDRRVGDFDTVVQFVTLLQTAQDGDGRLDVRLVDHDFLEATLKRGVLLDVFAIFVKRRRADAMQLTARQRRLEHVARVHRALGLAGPNHGV